MSRHLGLLAVTFWSTVLGCHPVTPTYPLMLPAFTSINMDTTVLARARAEALSTRQLKALLGDPELVLPMAEFVRLLQSSEKDEVDRVEDSLSHIYTAYAMVAQMRGISEPVPGNWRSSERFNSLQVWVYMWEKPDQVETIVPGLFETRLRWSFSYLFLVEDNQIVSCSRLTRNQTSRK
jgi:hypothetical protein